MAPPIDAALLATQTYKLRPAGQAGVRQKSAQQATGGETPAMRSAGRRQAPAVALSLSAEALSLLSGETGKPAAVSRDPYDAAAREAAPQQAQSDDAVFEPIDFPARPQREAPFAHLDTNVNRRNVPPGSRLDITI
jgi:hypothetical protein